MTKHFREKKIVNGMNHTLSVQTGEWIPEIKYENGLTWILDERSETMTYYALAAGKLKPSEITREMKDKIFRQADEASMKTKERLKKYGMTETEFSLIPPEEAHRYYKTEQGFWKEIREEEVPENLHGKYITLRRNYLMNHLPETYLKLKESGRLNYHLTEINQRAHELMEMITEQLKENNQEYQQAEEQADFLKMVRMTETYGKIAEETILKEIIYSE